MGQKAQAPTRERPETALRLSSRAFQRAARRPRGRPPTNKPGAISSATVSITCPKCGDQTSPWKPSFFPSITADQLFGPRGLVTAEERSRSRPFIRLASTSVGTPPASETRRMGPGTEPKMITPSRFHAPVPTVLIVPVENSVHQQNALEHESVPFVNVNVFEIIGVAEVPEWTRGANVECPFSLPCHAVLRLPFAGRSPSGDPGAAAPDRRAPTLR